MMVWGEFGGNKEVDDDDEGWGGGGWLVGFDEVTRVCRERARMDEWENKLHTKRRKAKERERKRVKREERCGWRVKKKLTNGLRVYYTLTVVRSNNPNSTKLRLMMKTAAFSYEEKAFICIMCATLSSIDICIIIFVGLTVWACVSEWRRDVESRM